MYVSGIQEVFENVQECNRDSEIEHLNRVVSSRSYMDGVGPYGELTEGFRNLLESGDMVKFAISERGMFIGKADLSHAYIASFQYVLTAGYARCIGVSRGEHDDKLGNKGIGCINLGFIRRNIVRCVERCIGRSVNGNHRGYESLESKGTFNLEVNNHTGHYRTTVSSLRNAVLYFKSMGYNVSVVKNWETGEPVDLNDLN